MRGAVSPPSCCRPKTEHGSPAGHSGQHLQPPSAARRCTSHHGACHCPAGGGACPIFHWSITMSLDLETTAADAAPVQGELLDAESSPLTLSLQDFVGEFGDELLDSLNRANPPVYSGEPQAHRQLIVASLKRKLFQAQAEVVHAARSEEHTSELQSLMRISYAVLCLTKKTTLT